MPVRPVMLTLSSAAGKDAQGPIVPSLLRTIQSRTRSGHAVGCARAQAPHVHQMYRINLSRTV
jgi:hypothetical protein